MQTVSSVGGKPVFSGYLDGFLRQWFKPENRAEYGDDGRDAVIGRQCAHCWQVDQIDRSVELAGGEGGCGAQQGEGEGQMYVVDVVAYGIGDRHRHRQARSRWCMLGRPCMAAD
jgi:hypothetical protein